MTDKKRPARPPALSPNNSSEGDGIPLELSSLESFQGLNQSLMHLSDELNELTDHVLNTDSAWVPDSARKTTKKGAKPKRQER